MPKNTKKLLAFCLIVLGTAIPLLLLGFALKAVLFSDYRAAFENIVIAAGMLMVLWWGVQFLRKRRSRYLPRD
jgi:arginine exporter protein ArgO